MIDDHNYQGFKISNSHVRLGSKIHIRDFYYASRLFQNSYFANRFGIIVAKYITRLWVQENLMGKDIVVTGYGKYSELLIVRVMKILRNMARQYGIGKVDYEIISDTEVPCSLREYKFRGFERVFLVIPIGSTLSTGIKMRNFLLTQTSLRSEMIIQPFINLLLASDGNLDKARLDKFKNDKNDIYYQYGWQEIDLDKKIIRVSMQGDEKTQVEQKYFISLESRWYNIQDCELCFPRDALTKEADYLLERPLIETDRASVTPQLILSDNFDYSGKYLNLNPMNDKVLLDDSYYYYGHQVSDGNEHIHFIKPNEFLEKHILDVYEWLRQLSDPLAGNIFSAAAGKKIIFIAPEGNLNSNFTSLVNEVIFNNTANIIQYNTKNDCTELY